MRWRTSGEKLSPEGLRSPWCSVNSSCHVLTLQSLMRFIERRPYHRDRERPRYRPPARHTGTVNECAPPEDRQHGVFREVSELPYEDVHGLEVRSGRPRHGPPENGNDDARRVVSAECGRREHRDHDHPQERRHQPRDAHARPSYRAASRSPADLGGGPDSPASGSHGSAGGCLRQLCVPVRRRRMIECRDARRDPR